MNNIELKNINKHFYKNNGLNFKKNKANILKDISFVLKNNQIMGLIGKNGSGKTTLMKIIAGLILPDSGHIESQSKKVCLINNNPRSFYWRLSCMENLKFFGGLGGVSNADLKSNIYFYINIFNMEDSLNTPFRYLSSGQMQLMSLVRSLILKPDVLLLDEPTVNLDYDFKKSYISVVKNYIENNCASALWSSHDFHEIKAVADSYSILKDKKLVITDKETHKTKYQTSGYYIEVDIDSLSLLNNLNIEFTSKLKTGSNHKLLINFINSSENISVMLKKLHINNIGIYSVQPINEDILTKLLD